MAPPVSAGLLLYRRRGGKLQVFLIHPGGPYFRNKDFGVWSIPKGLTEPGEELLAAAIREFEEETGITPSAASYIPLTPVRMSSGKLVHAWAFEGEADAASIRSNTFTTEWPPRSGVFREYPEADRAGWFDLDDAARKITKGQVPLLIELRAVLT